MRQGLDGSSSISFQRNETDRGWLDRGNVSAAVAAAALAMID